MKQNIVEILCKTRGCNTTFYDLDEFEEHVKDVHMHHYVLDPVDGAIHEIIDHNKDQFKKKWEEAKNEPKFCENCKRDLKDYREGVGEVLKRNEYRVFQSILPGKEGDCSYWCYECSLHNHLPGVECQQCKLN